MAPDTSTPASLPVIILRPARGWLALHLRDVWEYRDLLYFLARRDVKVRYTQTVLGVAWAVLQPLLTMVIFSVIFGRLAQLPSNGFPYPIYTYAALLPWQLFSGGLTRASLGLVMDAKLLTKVYFPRLIIPLSAISAGLIDFAIALVVFCGLLLFYRVQVTWSILALPLVTIFALATTLAVSLWLSALNVQYRDVEHMIPFLIQAWMYASPIAYSVSLIPPGPAQLLYGLNPMAGVIQAFRWSLLGDTLPIGMLLVSVVVTIGLLVGGLFYFRRMENTFADVV
jgi:lipopolysaccharide transport system permease protein